MEYCLLLAAIIIPMVLYALVLYMCDRKEKRMRFLPHCGDKIRVWASHYECYREYLIKAVNYNKKQFIWQGNKISDIRDLRNWNGKYWYYDENYWKDKIKAEKEFNKLTSGPNWKRC